LNKIPSAWAEIHDVFGDGHEYDWALEGDDEADFNEEQLKPEMKYQDVCALAPSLLSFFDTSLGLRTF
jgi:hypothetical protein